MTSSYVEDQRWTDRVKFLDLIFKRCTLSLQDNEYNDVVGEVNIDVDNNEVTFIVTCRENKTLTPFLIQSDVDARWWQNHNMELCLYNMEKF